MKAIAKLLSRIGRIIAAAGVLDVRTIAALIGLASLTRGVAGKWDFDTALIVLGVLLLAAIAWIPAWHMLLVARGPRS